MTEQPKLKTTDKTPEHLEMDKLYAATREKINSDNPTLVAEGVKELHELEQRCLNAGIK